MSVNASSRTIRVPAAVSLVNSNSITEVNSSGSSDVTPAPAKTQRSSSSTVGIPTQTAPSPASMMALGNVPDHQLSIPGELSRRSDGAPLLPTQTWFPTAPSQPPHMQPQHFQQNNKNDVHMTDTSTHDTYTQNIQNNAVISVTTLDPTIAAEAMRVTGELSAQLSATQIAAHQSQQQLQHVTACSQQESQNKDVQLQSMAAGFQQHTAATGMITQEREGAFMSTIMELQAAIAKMQAETEQNRQQQANMQTMYDQQLQREADLKNRCEQQQQQQVNMQAMYEQKITQLQLAGQQPQPQPQQVQSHEKSAGFKPETSERPAGCKPETYNRYNSPSNQGIRKDTSNSMSPIPHEENFWQAHSGNMFERAGSSRAADPRTLHATIFTPPPDGRGNLPHIESSTADLPRISPWPLSHANPAQRQELPATKEAAPEEAYLLCCGMCHYTFAPNEFICRKCGEPRAPRQSAPQRLEQNRQVRYTTPPRSGHSRQARMPDALFENLETGEEICGGSRDDSDSEDDPCFYPDAQRPQRSQQQRGYDQRGQARNVATTIEGRRPRAERQDNNDIFNQFGKSTPPRKLDQDWEVDDESTVYRYRELANISFPAIPNNAVEWRSWGLKACAALQAIDLSKDDILTQWFREATDVKGNSKEVLPRFHDSSNGLHQLDKYITKVMTALLPTNNKLFGIDFQCYLEWCAQRQDAL